MRHETEQQFVRDERETEVTYNRRGKREHRTAVPTSFISTNIKNKIKK